MTTIKDGNKFKVDELAKKVKLTDLTGKNVKNLTNKQQQELLIALAQLAGIALPDGTIKGKVN